MKSLAGVRSHSERIMIATFQENPATSVTVTYAPTNASKMETVEGYYADLRRAIESLPVHTMLVILGDFNAKLGPSDAAYSHHEKTNKSGTFLSELAQEK